MTNKRQKGDIGKKGLLSFSQILNSGSSVYNCTSTRDMRLPVIHYFTGQWQKQWLPIVLSKHNNPHSTGQVNNVGILSPTNYIYPSYLL